MKKFFKITGLILVSLIATIVLAIVFFNVFYFAKNLKAKKVLTEVELITQNGFQFRDLNKNGELDVYEDSRQNIELRIDNLLSLMTIEEKAGLMWHPPIGVGKKGEVLGKPDVATLNMVSTYDVLVNKKMNHFK